MPRALYKCKIPGISLILIRQYHALNSFAYSVISLEYKLNLATDDYLFFQSLMEKRIESLFC